MNWMHENASAMTLDQILNAVRDNASLIIIFLLLWCLWYLRRTSQRLAYIGEIMRDVKWISSKEKV